ncbi:unnamed protein product [Oreochromis niloticus]|nr:unnamed protein product [Mustela putorius furo]
MPSTQKKLNLGSKPGKSGENHHPLSDHAAAVMAEAQSSPLLGQMDVNKLVERISAEALKAVEASFEKKIDPVLKRLETCAANISALDVKMKEAETRISTQEDITAGYGAKISEVELKLEAALDKIDDLENRSRRCNIRVIGLPEGSEVNIKLHNFQDKARIMQAARRKQSLFHNGIPIMIFEDFSAAVLKKRQGFYHVKQRLGEMGIPFAMMYPAVLRIKIDGQEKSFRTPEAVSAYLDNVPQGAGPRSSSVAPADCWSVLLSHT